MDFEELERIDKLRQKMLKYILYKKRTEHEIRQKFEGEANSNDIEDAIEYFKGLKYIDDFSYIERSIQEFMSLKNLSIKEISYKLYQKGIDRQIVDEYIYNHREELLEYEINSARNIWNKKVKSPEDEKSAQEFLYKKGYMKETVKLLGE